METKDSWEEMKLQSKKSLSLLRAKTNYSKFLVLSIKFYLMNRQK